MYKINQQPKLTDLIDRNNVYRCINDVHCQNGIFEKGSLVFLDLVRINKTKPYKYALKLSDCKESLDITTDEVTQDIAPNVGAMNFYTFFEVAEDINDKIDNSKYIIEHDSYLRLIHRLEKVCVFIFAIFALLLTFACGATVSKEVILTSFFEDLTKLEYLIKLSFILSGIILLFYILCKLLLWHFSNMERFNYLDELDAIIDDTIEEEIDEANEVDEELIEEISNAKNEIDKEPDTPMDEPADRYEQFLEDFMNVVNDDIDD